MQGMDVGSIHIKSRHSFKIKKLFPMNSGVSERASEWANERSGARERSEQCGASEWVSGASEWANGGTNGPVLYVSISYHLNPPWDACSLMHWLEYRMMLSTAKLSFPTIKLRSVIKPAYERMRYDQGLYLKMHSWLLWYSESYQSPMK